MDMTDNNNGKTNGKMQISIRSYTPQELYTIVGSEIQRRMPPLGLVAVTGIYMQARNAKLYDDGYYYDHIRGESDDSKVGIVILMNDAMRSGLENGDRITVVGVPEMKMRRNTSDYSVVLRVSRVARVAAAQLTAQGEKLLDCRLTKTRKGFRNVDDIIAKTIASGHKLRLLAICPLSSVAKGDFVKGLGDAIQHVDLKEINVNFSNPTAVSRCIEQADYSGSYDLIALLRGGGSGIESIDDPIVGEAIARLNTPILYGMGHEDDRLLIRSIVDKDVPTPKAAGSYIREQVEKAVNRKADDVRLIRKNADAEQQIDTYRTVTKALVIAVVVLVLALAAALIILL